MVEISLSGSGEGPGGAIPWGYSTADPTDQAYAEAPGCHEPLGM